MYKRQANGGGALHLELVDGRDEVFTAQRGRLHHLRGAGAVSYTHLRAHETVLDLVCRLLLEKKNTHGKYKSY